ncbi:MAG: hypothetical protein HYR56_21390 [Acidobacteria bacterium]|nr:hypothetical protein [Acidobacteriota bacterium]MBI3427636.1 hypothetical protein [Acidobacteriota bacterium]
MTTSGTEFVYQARLAIKGRPDFLRQTREALAIITGINIGNQLLQSLAASRRTVVILESTAHNLAVPDDFSAAIASGQKLEWKELYGKASCLIGTGAGSDTQIHFNPSYFRIGTAESWQTAPAALWLAHELIHADDAAWGRMNPTKVDGLFNYERQAIGLAPYELKEFTENRFRSNWTLLQPLRTSY